jgi:hypothetical protein
MSDMNPQRFIAPISELYASVTAMAQNLTYIQEELSHWDISNTLKSEIVTVCQEFESALYDVRKEIRTLEDKLGMHPGEEPFDPGVVNPDPQVTLELIERWLAAETEAMHALVLKLGALAETDLEVMGVNVLVTESAANILLAQIQVKQALAAISRLWRAAP